VFAKSDMIVKVKEPQPNEWVQLRDNQILYTYLHLAPDPEQTKGKMEKLIAKVEKLLPTESAEPAKNLSPAELLARQWREALAANTMGAGAARQAEDARQRAADQEVRSAQAAWARLGPLAPDQRKPLQDRFDRAVRKFSEMKRRSAARA